MTSWPWLCCCFFCGVLVERHRYIIDADYKYIQYKDPGIWTNHLVRWRFLAVFFCLKERRFSIWLNQHRGGFTTTNQTIEESLMVTNPSRWFKQWPNGYPSQTWEVTFTTFESTGHLKISPQKQGHIVKICYFLWFVSFFSPQDAPRPQTKKNKPWFLASVVLHVWTKIVRYRFGNAAFWTTNLNSWGHRFQLPMSHGVPCCFRCPPTQP